MRVIALFVVLLLVSLFLSALINYPLYALIGDLTDKGPHKLINTTAKLIAIPGFILLLRYFAVNNKQALGYALPRREFIVDMFKGLGMGIGILLGLAAVLLLLEIRVPRELDNLMPLLAKTLLAAVISGLLIGFIEETFFRGGIFPALRKQHVFVASALYCSIFYAAMHFIKQPPLPEGEVASFANSFWMLSGAFDQYAQAHIWDSFLALFILGLYLALLRERTGNLAYVVGVHAGVVMVIKFMKKFTEVNHANELSWLVGSYDGIVGYLSAAGLSIHLVISYYFWRRPGKQGPRDSTDLDCPER